MRCNSKEGKWISCLLIDTDEEINYYPTAFDAVHWLPQILWSREVQISNTTPKVGLSKSHCRLVFLHVLFQHYNCHSDTVYYNLQNAQWSQEYSAHSVGTDTHVMCAMHVTAKLHRAECSLYDAALHFSNQRNSCSCILFKFCNTAQLYIGTNFTLPDEKRSRKCKEIWC